jgi:hypothetical protein
MDVNYDYVHMKRHTSDVAGWTSDIQLADVISAMETNSDDDSQVSI